MAPGRPAALKQEIEDSGKQPQHGVQPVSHEDMPQDGAGLPTRDTRRVGRVVRRNLAGALIRASGTDADTDVAQAKVDNLTMATGSAMSSVVRVAQAQRHLEQLAPEAAGRLACLADDHMLAMSEVLAKLRRDMHRRDPQSLNC